MLAELWLVDLEDRSEILIAESVLFDLTHHRKIDLCEGSSFDLGFEFDNILDIIEEPGVDHAEVKHLLNRNIPSKGFGDVPYFIPASTAKFFL